MTPFSLNPQPHGPSFPLTDHQIEDQNQFFVSPTNQDSSSLSSRSFFNILDQTQNRQIGELRHDQEDERPVLHGGSSNHQVCPTSSVQAKFNSGEVYSSFYKLEEGESKSSYESLKWMPSKMRLMRKMMTPTNPEVSNINHTQRQENSHRSPANGNSTTRVCSDCNTTSTPLWRSGPKGPKSLCNACGIRQRKARRAMAEAAAAAANGEAASTNASWTKSRVHSKEKKPRTNHFALKKHKGKPTNTAAATSQEARKLDFKGFALSLSNNEAFQQVFHRDEVAEAALLLMDLSCGFVHI